MRILAGILFVTACVASTPPADQQQLDWHSGGKADGQSCDYDTQSGQTYLGNFLYKQLDDNTSGDHWYRAAFTWDIKATLPSGDKAATTAYLLGDGRAIVEYSEEHPSGNDSYDVLNQTVVVTGYTVDDTSRTLTIRGVGTGTPITVTGSSGCLPGYTFQYSDDIRTAGLAGGTAVLDAGSTSAVLVDPDHLDQAPAGARDYFNDEVASGQVVVIHR